MKQVISIFIVLLITVFACNQASTDKSSETTAEPTQSSSVPAADNSQNALDWDGTYSGTVPCADCEGIETTLTLNKDNSYVMKTKYKGKSEEVIEKAGTFSWNSSGSAVILGGIENAPSQYQVGENVLFQLDMNGKRITGELAEKYQLKKISNQIN